MVRFDTYNASAHLVRQLESSGVATVRHDGGDNLLVQVSGGDLVSIYLIETILPPYEARTTLQDNTRDGIHTLFILWGEMFLPEHDDHFAPDDWMIALLKLYDNKLYAFDVFGKDIRIYPAYFEPLDAQTYRVTHAADIDVTRLGCDVVQLRHPDDLRGVWRIADFSHPAHRPAPPPAYRPPTAWQVLGVAEQASLATVKNAYRQLARLYHPDINTDPDATRQMQRLNEAYQTILQEIAARQDSPSG